MDLRNEKVVVVGLGTSGMDACLLLNDLGAIVSATDSGSSDDLKKNSKILSEKYIEVEIGTHTEGFLAGSDLMVISPGVSKDALPIQYAIANNRPLISELELGFACCKGSIVAVTGTNGKSTVVTLIGEILKKAGKKVVVCGNIGNSLCGEIHNIDSNTIVVLEVSSFQLEWIVDFRPKISCILNITEDHLERYISFEDYVKTKMKIFSKQESRDLTILNYDDVGLRHPKEPIKAKTLYYSKNKKVNGIYCQDGDVIYNKGGKSKKLFSMPSSRLKGEYNIENILAAVLIALTEGADLDSIKEAVEGFIPLRHRMEYLGNVNGIEFIDDSKATNIDATKRALESLDKKVILIAGGRDKGGDYALVKDEIVAKVDKLVLIGEAATRMNDFFKGFVKEIELCDTLEEATRSAFSGAKNKQIVLLSPMCSSFDMFSSYKERGDVFKKTIEEIKSQPHKITRV